MEKFQTLLPRRPDGRLGVLTLTSGWSGATPYLDSPYGVGSLSYISTVSR